VDSEKSSVKIGVISDTHLKDGTKELTELIQGPFQNVDMIFHAGDITDLGVLDSFAGKKTLAVCGNMDSDSVRQQLPTQKTVQIKNFHIGLIHGWGSPDGIEDRIRREFGKVDCIVFGHTHTPYQGNQEGVFFFNPGAFGGRFFSHKRTVGLLIINDRIQGHIIHL
jgi:uncharacterized protein